MGELSYECTLSQFEKEITFLAAMMAYVASMMVEDVDVVDGKFSSYLIFVTGATGGTRVNFFWPV